MNGLIFSSVLSIKLTLIIVLCTLQLFLERFFRSISNAFEMRLPRSACSHVHIFTYSSLVLNENITLSPRVINFGKRLSQKLELAQKIKLIPCDLDSQLQHVHSFMMIAEARFEIGLEKNRIKNRRFWQKDKEFYEFMLTSSNEFGLHPETYFQVS